MKKEAWEGHELLRRATTPTFTHTPVTFDAVVVQCFCHGGQSLVPRVTIDDQLGGTDGRSVTLIHVTFMAYFHAHIRPLHHFSNPICHVGKKIPDMNTGGDLE